MGKATTDLEDERRGKGPRQCWVDTSMGAKNKKWSKPHVAYDGEKIIQLKRLTKLTRYDEVFIDAAFPEIYNDLIELLSKGVRVYVLKDTRLLKTARDLLKLQKSDTNDAVALSTIPLEAFKELTLKEVELRKLLVRYEQYSGLRRRVRTWVKQYPGLRSLKVLENELERECQRLEAEITETARYMLPFYRVVQERLGLRGVSIVNLLLHIDFSKNMHKIKIYVLKNRRIKGILSRYIASTYIRVKGKGRSTNEYEELITKAPSIRKAMKVGMKILKAIRRLWLQCNEERARSTPGQ